MVRLLFCCTTAPDAPGELVCVVTIYMDAYSKQSRLLLLLQAFLLLLLCHSPTCSRLTSLLSPGSLIAATCKL